VLAAVHAPVLSPVHASNLEGPLTTLPQKQDRANFDAPASGVIYDQATTWRACPKQSVDDDAAGHFAGLHGAERVVHVVEPDAAGQQRLEIEPALTVEAHHLGKVP